MWPFDTNNRAKDEAEIEKLVSKVEKLSINSTVSASIRDRIASAVSGSNFTGDTLHQVELDYGYPDTLQFEHFWNMYRRFGIAKSVVELPVKMTWLTRPRIVGLDDNFAKFTDKRMLWQRVMGLDTRQRVGRYAGMFMRVRDGKQPEEPLTGVMSGEGALVEMVPLYEGQLQVLTTDTDPTSDTYDQPTMYQYHSTAPGNRNEKAASSFSIHPSRLVMAAEGADNGGIYGIPCLEACYNSLMDLRKIIGAGGEGFYKNAAQSIVFELADLVNAGDNKELLEKFNENADDFMRNRSRRSLWAPGMKSNVLTSDLADAEKPFNCALNDVAAASGMPAPIIIGQQTGRLASNEDSRTFLSVVNARRESYGTELVKSVIDWCMRYGILQRKEYTVEWDDLLALSDGERLKNAESMSRVNQGQANSGGKIPFTGENIREMAGYTDEVTLDYAVLPDKGGNGGGENNDEKDDMTQPGGEGGRPREPSDLTE